MSYINPDLNSPDSAHQSPTPHAMLLSASTLMGNEVYNKGDENLGDIKDFMLDVHSGQICFAVLSFGGFMGMGGKLFAVPWRALKLDTENKRFVLDVSEERLKQAPGFDKDHWPDMGDAAWAHGIDTYYGIKPESGADRPLM